MTTKRDIKGQLIIKLNEVLDKRIIESQNALEAARESRDNETKSSVGDKYETGRAMVQIEMGKYQDQLTKALKLKKALALINTKKEYGKAEFGSLVITNLGNYFISVGLGMMEDNGTRYFAISLASPIGKSLEGKLAGDKVAFQGKTFEIVELI